MKYADLLRAQAAEVYEKHIAPLEAERAALKTEADAITGKATDESRSLTELEDSRLTAILARNKEIATAITEHEADVKAKTERADELDALEVERRAAPTFIRPAEKPDPSDVRTMSPQQVVDTIVRNIEDHEIDPSFAQVLLKRHRSDIDWARGLALRSTQVYSDAFAKVITGNAHMLTNEERTALSVGTAANGGYLTPTHLDPTVILTNTGSNNIMRQLARTVTLTAPGDTSWQGIASSGVSASFDAELTEVSDDSPTFSQPTVSVHQAQAFVQASVQSVDDIAGLAGEVLMMFADAKDRLEGDKYVNGSGTAEPKGIFPAIDAVTAREVTSTTAATIGLVDLQGVKNRVGQRWRSRASWLTNPTWGDEIKRLGTALSASYSTDITQANTDRLLGAPLYESDDCPAVTTTTALDTRIVFGDFSNYLIVDKPGSMSIEFIPHLFNTATNLPDGRRGWYARWRTGGDAINTTAFSLLLDKTSA